MKKILSGLTNFLVIPFVLLLFVFFYLPAKVSAANIEIYTLEDLNSVRSDLTADYVLMNDLDFQNDTDYENIANKSTWTTGEGWTPIATYATPFTGTFDGQDYTISNLFMNKSSGDYIGLFASIESATITNLSLTQIDITALDSWYVGGLIGYTSESDVSNCNIGGSVDASNQVGGLIGRNEQTLIDNCHVTGDITGEDWLGGLIGYNQDSSVADSSFSGSVTTNTEDGSNIGGLIGYNSLLMTEVSTITNCYTSGSVTGQYSVGGLIGYNEDSNISNSSSSSDILSFNEEEYSQSFGGLVGDNIAGDISNSYATGDVTGSPETWSIGGLVGDNSSGNILNSYAIGDVTGYGDVGGLLGSDDGTTTDSYSTGNVIGEEDVGGFVGYTYGSISNSYSTGSVTGNTDIGGFIGYDGGVTVGNSFWDTQTSGLDNSPAGIGKTTSEMQTSSTFSAWDISLIGDFDELDPTTWFIDESTDYPKLAMQYVEPDDGSEDPGDDSEDPGDDDEDPGDDDEDPSDDSEDESALSPQNSNSIHNSFSIKTPTCTDWAPTTAPYLFQINTTKTQAKLYFVPASGSVNKYFIAYSSQNTNAEEHGVEYAQGYSGGVLSYTINFLNPNTSYYFKVRAGNGCMPGSWSAIMKVKTSSTEILPKVFYQ